MVAQVTAAALTEQCPLYEPEARQPEYLVSAQEYDLDTLPEMEDYGKALLTLLGGLLLWPARNGYLNNLIIWLAIILF